MVDGYAKNIESIEIHHVFYFLSAMLDKGVAYSTINNVKCAVATILYILTYPSINRHPLVMKCITGIFNLRPPKANLNNVWDVDIFLGTLKN